MLKISEIYENVPRKGATNLEKEVYTIFQKLNIPFTRVENDPVSTMEECVQIKEKLNVEIRKSIFLRNKKGNSFFLVILPADRQLDVKNLENKIKVSNLSFATEEDMETHLKMKAGSISIVGTLNDKDDYVQVLIDKEVAFSEYFGLNTGVNTSHAKIKTDDLLHKFLPYTHHKAKIVDL